LKINAKKASRALTVAILEFIMDIAVVLFFAHADDSLGDRVYTSICLCVSVSLSTRYIKKPLQLG